MDAIEALHHRISYPRLAEPAPDKAALETIFKAALRAPDHGMLRPWRFLLIEGEARNKLGELFVEARQPDTEEKRNKLLNAPLRAPLIIVAIAEIKEHPSIPPIEQITSTAAAVQNMSLAAFALGYGSIWRTGPVAFDDKVKLGLGVSPEDEIVGYLYLGTPTVADRPVPEVDIENHVAAWP